MDGLLATKEIVVACGPGGVGKTTTAAAAAIMAAIRHGSKVLVLTVDPARRLADALGSGRHRQHRAPGPRRGLPRRGDQAAGAAVGGHARHQGELGRSHPTACTRCPDPGRDPGQSALPEHLGEVRAESRLHRHGAALRDPLGERLRPDRGGHPAHPQRTGLPRCPPAHGRLLLLQTAALADRPVPLAPGQRGHQTLLSGGRPDPGHRVPRRHLRVLHPVPVHVRGVRRAFGVSGPAPLRPADHLHRGVHPGGGTPAGGRVLRRAADFAVDSIWVPSS